MAEKKSKRSKEEIARVRAENGKLGGRPPFQVDYGQLKKLCQIFCTGEDAAALLGCDYDTLNAALKRDYEQAIAEEPGVEPVERGNGFSDYYKKNSSTGRASLRRWQFEKARAGNTSMLIFLGKNYLEQSDRIDHSSSDGSMTPKPALDVSQLSTEALREIQNASTKSE